MPYGMFYNNITCTRKHFLFDNLLSDGIALEQVMDDDSP